MKLSVFFAYLGTEYEGLERTKGDKTIEAELLTALAKVGAINDAEKRISFTNISRASTTEAGEHAARQIISLELNDQDALFILANQDKINQFLEGGKNIKVFKVMKNYPGGNGVDSFSARRSCNARTYEFVVPTYVFNPAIGTTYYSEPVEDVDSKDLFPPPDDREPVLTTLRRSLSRKRSKRAIATADREKSVPPLPSQAPVKEPVRQEEYALPEVPIFQPSPVVLPKKQGFFKKIFSTLSRKGNGASSSTEIPSPPESPLQNKPNNAPKSMKRNSFEQDPESKYVLPATAITSSPLLPNNDHEGFMTTIKRTLSRRRSGIKRNATVKTIQTIEDSTLAAEAEEPTYHEPINIPDPTEEELSVLRQSRITPKTFEALKSLIGLFQGTHNFHNYVPGAKYEDPRCYIRILEAEVMKPEIHYNMEFVTIKFTSHAFARYQIRRMLALAIQLIRTNTPRSLAGNSFGFAKIELPEAPEFGLFLSSPHYNEYNAKVAPEFHVLFDEDDGGFKKDVILNNVYRMEMQDMKFKKWLTSLDRVSFLFEHYLNSRGLIKPRSKFLLK